MYYKPYMRYQRSCKREICALIFLVIKSFSIISSIVRMLLLLFWFQGPGAAGRKGEQVGEITCACLFYCWINMADLDLCCHKNIHFCDNWGKVCQYCNIFWVLIIKPVKVPTEHKLYVGKIFSDSCKNDKIKQLIIFNTKYRYISIHIYKPETPFHSPVHTYSSCMDCSFKFFLSSYES